MKFDPTKPYGTLHGTNDSRRYEQDGKIFDCDGNEIVAVDFSSLTIQAGPRKRTREEEAQYQKDVVDAAALLAASKK